jgi:hypothetical protein
MTDEELNRRFDAVVELIASVADRIDKRFAALEAIMNTRFDALEARMDRLESRMSNMEFQMAAMNRSFDQRDRIISQITATQMAQQKAIEDLAARLAKLEQQRQQ